MNATNAPTNATLAKHRLYSRLSASLSQMSRAIGQTAELCDQLQVDLLAMRTFAGLDAAKLMTVGVKMNQEAEAEAEAEADESA